MKRQDKRAFKMKGEINGLDIFVAVLCLVLVFISLFGIYQTSDQTKTIDERVVEVPVVPSVQPIPHNVEDPEIEPFDIRLQRLVDTLEENGYTCTYSNPESD